MLRAPLAAGQFYPSDPSALQEVVENYLANPPDEQPALLAIVPHAGYIYSGALAGRVFAQVQVPEHVLLIGPNHSGRGNSAALASYRAWQTPLGRTALDIDLNRLLLEENPLIREDNQGHSREHSLEVELPFLQAKQPQLKISALSLGRLSWLQLEETALGLSRAIKRLRAPVLMVASTDMNHYLDAEETQRRDQMAIDRIINLDPAGLCRTVAGNHISMCGVLAVALGLRTALYLGASQARLVGYCHSGQVNHDHSRVVGYAGALIRA